MQREKKTISGRLLEADIFPVFDNSGHRLPTRAPKTKPTEAAKARYNAKQAEKKLVRLVNTNFDERDFFIHPTFRQETAPQEKEAAQREFKNYIKRIKRYREKEIDKTKKKLREATDAAKKMPQNKFLENEVKRLKERARLLNRPFKWLYVTERQEYKSGSHKGRVNWHLHGFVSGGLTRDEIERLWTAGAINADRYQPDAFGPEAAAMYIVKDPQGRKRFSHSQNCEKPKTPKPKDGKLTRRAVERMAKERVDDREFWEKRYKGYRFLKCYPRYNEYNGHWYVSVVMWKSNNGDPPKWRDDEWANELW